MMEDKIIKDVLLYLDGWALQNKDHKHRHKPKPTPKYLDPFNETSDEIENTNIRKTITSKEILDMYEVAKIHALNYIKRPVYPRTPVTHISLCMWTAGLLAQKARFIKDNDEKTFNLIKEAKDLLKPYIKHNPTILSISGSDTDMYEVEQYSIQKHHPTCPKHKKKRKHPCIAQHPSPPKHKNHHPKHHHHPPDEDYPYFEYDEPEYEDFFLKRNHIQIKLNTAHGELDEKITLKAYVRDVYGNRIDGGKIQFYIIDDEEDF